MIKKIIIIILSLIAFILFGLCGAFWYACSKIIDDQMDMKPKEFELKQAIVKFEQIIDSGDFDDLTLTIYHTSPYGERERMSVNALKEYVREHENKENGTYRVDVNGAELEKYGKQLNEISSDKIALRNYGYNSVDTRIYYEFKYKDEILLRVALWGYQKDEWPIYNGSNASAIINGRFEVKNIKGLCEAIKPFLNEDDARYLENFIDGTMPDFMKNITESENMPREAES